MEMLPRQKYTKEFREQAVRLVTEQELTIPEAARRLSMSGQTLSNWVFKARHGQLAGMDAPRSGDPRGACAHARELRTRAPAR